MESIHIMANAADKRLIEEAAKSVGLSVSAFLRCTAIEKARVLLGKPPTLPVYVATRDKR